MFVHAQRSPALRALRSTAAEQEYLTSFAGAILLGLLVAWPGNQGGTCRATPQVQVVGVQARRGFKHPSSAARSPGVLPISVLASA